MIQRIKISEPRECTSDLIRNAIGGATEWFHMTERTWQLHGREQEKEITVQFSIDGDNHTVRGSSVESIMNQIKGCR